MIAFDVRQLQRAVRGIQRFREVALNIAGDEFVAQVREFAASGRNADGSQWRQLTPRYAATKQAKFGNASANKRATGALLNSVKNRGGIVAPDASQMAKAQGLERLRISFEPSPITAQNIERILLREWNKI